MLRVIQILNLDNNSKINLNFSKNSKQILGGGYVEIKCILCGGNTTDAFELKCYVAKYLSTIFMAASGLPLGILASNIQFGAQIAFNLQKLSYFRIIKDDPVLQKQALATGAGLGLNSLWECPFTGILLGMDMSETIYTAHQFCLSFIASFFVTITVKLLNFHFKTFNLTIIDKETVDYVDTNFHLYILLGIICAGITIFYTKIQLKFNDWMKDSAPAFMRTTYLYALFINFIVCVTIWYFPILYRGDKRLLLYMFNDQSFKESPSHFLKQLAQHFRIITLLCSYLVINVLPMAGGTYGYTLCMGAVSGRIVSEFFDTMYPHIHYSKFAVAGAVAMGTSITHSFTFIMWGLEALGSSKHLYAIILTTITSFLISSRFTGSFMISQMTQVEYFYLPQLFNYDLYKQKAFQVMKQPKCILYENDNLNRIARIIHENEQLSLESQIPILKSPHDKEILGSIRFQNLIYYMKEKLQLYLLNNPQIKNANWVSYYQTLFEIYQRQTLSIPLSGKDLHDKVLHIQKKMFPQSIYDKSIEMDDYESVKQQTRDQFFSSQINLNSNQLNFDRSPLIIQTDTSVKKIHFLLIKTQVDQIYIASKNKLEGVIGPYQLCLENKKFDAEN